MNGNYLLLKQIMQTRNFTPVAGLLLAAIAFVGCIPGKSTSATTSSSASSSTKTASTVVTTKDLNQDKVKVALRFTTANVWEYTLTTDLPTPCHNLTENNVVMESFPEQVRMEVTITAPAKGTVCAQVITPVSKTGTINVDKAATFSLKVTRK
jgi:hypothetical protein